MIFVRCFIFSCLLSFSTIQTLTAYNNYDIAAIILRNQIPPKTAPSTTCLSSEATTNHSIESMREEEKKFRRNDFSFKSDFQIKREQKQIEQLKKQFKKIKRSTTEKIKADFVPAFQWGDNFPIAQGFFEHIGWREKTTIQVKKNRLEIELQSQKISCTEIQAMFVAMAIKNKNHKKQLEYLINKKFGCNQFTNKSDKST